MHSIRYTMRFATLLCLLFLSGCATYSANHPVSDPWENYNRAIYKFNDALDRYAVKPAAKGYRFITPQFVETGVHNFFSNIDDITVTINDLLQGKFAQAAQDAWRFLLNTTVGIGGLFDVATPLGLPKHNEDFGQTLGKWGVAEGPYFMLPFLGPSTLRSAGGSIVDRATDPKTYVTPEWARYSLIGGDLLDTRVQLLESSGLLDSAFDPYTFLRNAYVINRRQLAYDNVFPETTDAPSDADDPLDTLDDSDPLDALDALDSEADELDALDALDALDDAPAAPAADELDELDALDLLDLEQAND
ncbi:MAG TPA: ABC transporter [Gammaproteobacteria bacterium]|nr:ABC transporter [Gammaproteobacteria bacterium]